jgi:hypothetical protein
MGKRAVGVGFGQIESAGGENVLDVEINLDGWGFGSGCLLSDLEGKGLLDGSHWVELRILVILDAAEVNGGAALRVDYFLGFSSCSEWPQAYFSRESSRIFFSKGGLRAL